jgi:hypothetical protein
MPVSLPLLSLPLATVHSAKQSSTDRKVVGPFSSSNQIIEIDIAQP